MPNDYVVRWFQEGHQSVTLWEFQFQEVGSRDWEWVQRIEPVDECPGCLQAVVQVTEKTLFVRSRSLNETGYSEWSEPMSVLPEPDLGSSLIACLLFLAWVGRVRQWGRLSKRIRESNKDLPRREP